MTPSPLVRIPVKYGFFGGILASILLLTLFYLGRYPFIPIERTLLFGVFIFFAIKEYRDFYGGGYLHFWQGMMGGIVSYLTMAVVASVFLVIWGMVNDAYLTHYILLMTEQLEANRVSLEERVGKEALALQLEKLPLTTMVDLALDYFLKSLFIGIFLTIIISVILRRQPKNI
jgi:hypothetical protein